MEIFLHLWDELDDLAGVCRHIATSAAAETANLARPLISVATSAAAALQGLASLKNLI
jgi:hypothetical protein